jgi:SAM-dependent methyltransferase
VTWGDHLVSWWLEEVAGDPAYTNEVIPLLLDLLEPEPGRRLLDLGCGDGRVMAAVAATGAEPVGCDVSRDLAGRAAAIGPVVVARLPDLGWLRPESLDGAYAVLVIEHLPDAAALFSATARVVRRGGDLVLVANHPAFTSPGSGPVVDPEDGEVLWRWGPYLEDGASDQPAGEHRVTFHHRAMGSLLGAAASGGWALERAVERGVGEAQVEHDALLAAQRHIPRLLAVRWRRG